MARISDSAACLDSLGVVSIRLVAYIRAHAQMCLIAIPPLGSGYEVTLEGVRFMDLAVSMPEVTLGAASPTEFAQIRARIPGDVCTDQQLEAQDLLVIRSKQSLHFVWAGWLHVQVGSDGAAWMDQQVRAFCAKELGP